MNVFELRERLISYSSYIRSFIRIRDARVDAPDAWRAEAGGEHAGRISLARVAAFGATSVTECSFLHNRLLGVF